MADATQNGDETAKIKNDIETLKSIVANLNEEEQKINDLIVQMKEKFESETADDFAAMDEIEKQVDDLDKKADEEEQQQGVASAQQDVQDS